MRKTVLVVDDHPLYQKALAGLVRELGLADEVYTAYSAEEGLRLLHDREPPALLLLDLSLPGITGVESVRAFRRMCPLAALVIVSASDNRQETMAAARCGANAVVSKGADMEALRAIVIQALSGGLAEGQKWVTPPGARSLASDMPLRLTPRQVEIVALLSHGMSNKEIAMRVGLAEITVKTHLSAVFRSLHVANRTQAVMAIRRFGVPLEARTGVQAAASPH